MSIPRAALCLTACSLSFLPVVAAKARAGALLSVDLVETLAPRAVDREVQKLFDGAAAPVARYAVRRYVVHLESRYPDGRVATITAQLFLPESGHTQPRIVYVFASGTTGLVDACRPSREHIAGIHWGLYRSHVLAFAGQGVISALPDYMGFGDPKSVQPIYHA